MRRPNTITKKQMAAYCDLSITAKRVFTRMMEGKWYRWKPTPGKVMEELERAGLVVSGGRVNVITRCFMPVGTKRFETETYPLWPLPGVKGGEGPRGTRA